MQLTAGDHERGLVLGRFLVLELLLNGTGKRHVTGDELVELSPYDHLFRTEYLLALKLTQKVRK